MTNKIRDWFNNDDNDDDVPSETSGPTSANPEPPRDIDQKMEEAYEQTKSFDEIANENGTSVSKGGDLFSGYVLERIKQHDIDAKAEQELIDELREEADKIDLPDVIRMEIKSRKSHFSDDVKDIMKLLYHKPDLFGQSQNLLPGNVKSVDELGYVQKKIVGKMLVTMYDRNRMMNVLTKSREKTNKLRQRSQDKHNEVQVLSKNTDSSEDDEAPDNTK